MIYDAANTSLLKLFERTLPSRIACGLAIGFTVALACGAGDDSEPGWRPLPLITDGRINENWCHVGWGGFAVDGDALRTECDSRGLGLLVYMRERFGNCQLRIVFQVQGGEVQLRREPERRYDHIGFRVVVVRLLHAKTGLH